MLSVEEAKAKNVCRVCEKAPDFYPANFVFNFGQEHAHENCLNTIGVDWRVAGKAGVKTVDVKSCTRCGKDHAINFIPFKRQHSEDAWTHWGMCLTMQEPVFYKEFDDTSGDTTVEPPKA